jgi:putative membrane protein
VPGAADTTTDTTAPKPMTMTDANIFAKLDAANSEEVDEGKLATSKSKNAAVKKFAQMLVTDHSKMKKEGADLAKSLNITPELPAGDTSMAMAQHTMDMLKSATAFDSTFIATAIDGHQKTLDALNSMQGMATSDSLKTLISKAIPVVQHHLDEARALQGKMASSGTASGSSSMDTTMAGTSGSKSSKK